MLLNPVTSEFLSNSTDPLGDVCLSVCCESYGKTEEERIMWS